MSEDIDPKQENSKSKEKQTLSGVLHHVLDRILIYVGDMTQFSYSCSPKELNPKNILRLPLDFYLEPSRLLDLD